MDTDDVIDIFPTLVDGRLEVTTFLKAAKGLCKIVDDLGMLFSPLSSDMTTNITKINQGFCQFSEKNSLDELLMAERDQGGFSIFEAVIWLTRSLRFMLIFFQRFIHEKNENLQQVMVEAYKGSLEPYHNWATRKLFLFFKNICPSRTTTLTILEKRLGSNDIYKDLVIFCNQLEHDLNHIDEFVAKNNFSN